MHNQIKTILLLGTLSAILIGFGALLGRQWVVGFTLLAIVFNFGAYFFSDKIVLRVHRAQPITEHEAPRLYAIVRELATRAEIPMPRLFMMPSAQPNAFATGRNPAHGVVAVTEGIMQLLSERELRGVLAHEIGHIKNRDILVSTIAAAVAGAIAFIANMLQWTAIFGGGQDDDAPNPIAALALAFIAPIAATLVQLGISRSREFLADETGARLSNDPEALASALEKLDRTAHVIPPATAAPATASLFIVNPFSGTRSRLTNLFSTHPPMAERVRRLRGFRVGYAA
ncbi:MAG TPA: zinc metalloprotease HtpX [Thermoanaerobaculia bacterium]|jgi:heat shock protein HtpX|nr:zinc metalloprotease HtpX [Thermoanaerobaculia bacterium]